MSSSRQRLPVLPRQLLNSYSQVARWTSDCPQTHVWRPTEDYHPGTFPFPPAPLRAAAALQTARCGAGNPPPPPPLDKPHGHAGGALSKRGRHLLPRSTRRSRWSRRREAEGLAPPSGTSRGSPHLARLPNGRLPYGDLGRPLHHWDHHRQHPPLHHLQRTSTTAWISRYPTMTIRPPPSLPISQASRRRPPQGPRPQPGWRDGFPSRPPMSPSRRGIGVHVRSGAGERGGARRRRGRAARGGGNRQMPHPSRQRIWAGGPRIGGGHLEGWGAAVGSTDGPNCVRV